MVDLATIKEKTVILESKYDIYFPIVKKKTMDIVENPIFVVAMWFVVFFYVNYMIIKKLGQGGLYVAIFLVMAALVVGGTYLMGHYLIPGM